MISLFRWMRRRSKKCCRVCCCSMVILVILFCMYVRHMYHTSQCKNDDSLQLISDLCELYKKREVEGSFCHDFCETKTFHYEQCGNYKKGKKVLFMTCDNCVLGEKKTKVVMKMKTELKDRDMLELHVPEENSGDNSVKNFVKEYEYLVKNSFNFLHHQNFSNHKDILSFAWNLDFREFMSKGENKAHNAKIAIDSIWSLVQQSEYIMYRDLYNHSFIPKIYGTCGPAYFVENTQTLSQYEFDISTKWLSFDWKERATVAIKLIELMEKLHNMDQDLHLCDIKPDNFGIRDNGDITLIDTDCAMFHKGLLLQFEFSNCTTHEDCDFFDCRSFCDTNTNKCLLDRTNNNIQSVCEDVFIGYFSKLPTGLLRDPPGSIKVRLFQLLQECAYPGTETSRHSTRDHARDETVNALKTLLYQSINEQ